ncbi:MAG: sigma-70 family RNA polymerase sigma factor [Acidobacteria bacterium]|nr:sigma-70 family RNA polymerase sigma factor [Acidobacteriota bacterium]
MSQIAIIINENLNRNAAELQAGSEAGHHGQLCILDADDFFHRHYGRLYRTACRILKDAEWARDAVQDAFRNIFQNIRNFRGDSRLETWMTRIVVNACYGYLRKWKHSRTEPLITDPDHPEKNDANFVETSEDPRETTSRREVAGLLKKALAGLAKSHRDVIVLHDIQNRTIEEIAAFMALPSGTVKSRLFYGRRMLREALARQGY